MTHSMWRCPDEGACHHQCREACFRVLVCGPLSAANFPGDEWPAEVALAHRSMTEQGRKDLAAENSKLRGLICALCSDPSPYGSEAFNRVRDQVNPEHRELLFEVLGG